MTVGTQQITILMKQVSSDLRKDGNMTDNVILFFDVLEVGKQAILYQTNVCMKKKF